MSHSKRHPRWLWGAVVFLAVLHQDFWWWNDRTLVFGAVPIGLFYHALFSVAAAGLWALACRWAWPEHIEQWAEESPTEPPPPAPGEGTSA